MIYLKNLIYVLNLLIYSIYYLFQLLILIEKLKIYSVVMVVMVFFRKGDIIRDLVLCLEYS